MITSWLIENFFAAVVLTFAVLSVQRVLRSKPTLKHALWLLVLVKLVTPPIYNWPWAFEVSPGVESTAIAKRDSHEDEAGYNRWESERNEMIVISGSESALPVFDSAAPIEDNILDPAELFLPKDFTLFEHDPKPAIEIVAVDEELQQITSETASEKSSRLLWVQWGFGIWMAGTVLFVLIQSTRIVRTMLLLRNASPVPESLENKLEQFARRLGVKCPDIVAVAGIKTPLIWAVGRARLLWPLELASETSEWNEMNRWRGVLIHELAHLHRRDHWVGWLELFAGLLWWWNPFFWIARRQLRENAELACDAWVVQCLPEERRNYAETLLEVCQLKSRSVMPWPVVGASLRDRRSLERRLEMILKDNVTLRIPKLGFVAVLVLAVMALPGWSQQQKPKSVDPVVAKTKNIPIVVQDEGKVIQDQGVVVQTVDALKALDPLFTGQNPLFTGQTVDTVVAQSSKNRRANRQKVKRLEDQIADLQKQLKNLKAGKSSKSNYRTKAYTNTAAKVLYKARHQNIKAKIVDTPIKAFYNRAVLTQQFAWRNQKQSHVVESQTFSRVKYRLPKDKKKAKAVTDFVKAMFGGDGDKKKTHSIESGDDNTLTVIASSAIQSKVSSIIQMAHGDTKGLNLSFSGAWKPGVAYDTLLKNYLVIPTKKSDKRR